MKKKLLSLALVASLVFSLAACGKSDEKTNADPTSAPEATQAPDATKAPEETATPEAAKPSEPTGQLIVGNSTELTGDWEGTWKNNAADADVRELTVGYYCVTADPGGNYVWDSNVVADHKETMNEDGTKTFEITLQKDLVYNDGTPIKAQDYVARIYFYSSPVVVKAEGKGTAGMAYAGFKEYKAAAETNPAAPFSGLRLIDEYTFSLTISADYIPYYYDLTYANIYPFPMHAWLPNSEVKDDGAGVYFTNFDVESSLELVNTYRYFSDNRVSSGPYTLKSYDVSSKQAVLEVNPLYKGNFEGQKPLIKTLVYVKAEPETQIDNLKTGGLDIIFALAEGAEINAALDLVEQGGFNFSKFDRNGYGKLMFICDFGPTQFTAVRQAVAHLLDRNDFAKTFTGGYGSIVNGPYGLAQWMYQDAEDELDEKLNPYTYGLDTAINLLVQDGWVYGVDGSDYVSGVRYKKVTKEEAGDYAGNVTLADGTILMPLSINWCASTGNPVSELLKVKLAENPDVASAGMEIKQTVVEWGTLLNYMYRDASQGEEFAVPTYGMFNLATGFTPVYDMSYEWTLDPEMVALGYNLNRLYVQEMDDVSMDMVYEVESGDNEGYLKLWVQYVEMWNQLLPELPLYSNIYHDVYVERLKDYNPSALWDFSSAILYAYVTE